jgi:hypothetical protein
MPGDQTVLAVPASQISLPALPQPLSLAVVVDRSRSMQDNASLVTQALEQIRRSARQNTGGCCLTASPYRGEAPVRISLTI